MATSFDDLQLDPKLLQALKKKGFASPTPVQSACIPEALSGKDLVAQARTGTGKTLAYVLPALHRILSSAHGSAGWQALFLVPTRELCEQVVVKRDRAKLKRASTISQPAYHRRCFSYCFSHWFRRSSRRPRLLGFTVTSKLQCGLARGLTQFKPTRTGQQASL